MGIILVEVEQSGRGIDAVLEGFHNLVVVTVHIPEMDERPQAEDEDDRTRKDEKTLHGNGFLKFHELPRGSLEHLCRHKPEDEKHNNHCRNDARHEEVAVSPV